jgi:hypothetical protein
MIKNVVCSIASVISDIAFFQNIFFIIEFVNISKNLHQSSAGIGKRLKTQRLIETIAQNITKNTNQASKELLMKSTIQIGQLTDSIASCLSSGVSGLKIFLTM